MQGSFPAYRLFKLISHRRDVPPSRASLSRGIGQGMVRPYPFGVILVFHWLLWSGNVPAQQLTGSPPPESSPTVKRKADSVQPSPVVVRTPPASPLQLPTIVVTASGVGQSLGTVAQSLLYFDQDKIGESHTYNLTNFLEQNSVGSIANISPGQSYINIRGAQNGTGQGWDDASEVMVLINGRRAGTDNIGKLSTYDVDHIEVLRGPASVIYGSSAIGGVINLITKNGEDDPGNRIQGTFGSFNRYTGTAESGGPLGKNFDYYAEITGGSSGDYQSGAGSAGTMPNTAYTQGNLDLNFGYNINDLNRVDLTLRHDGLYNLGHPGVTYSLTDNDNRYNTSVDLDYTGATQDHEVSWGDHVYAVQDVDQFDWSQNPLIGPVNAAYGLLNRPGISSDIDTRRQNVIGDKLSAVIKPIESNSLLMGVDLEYSWLYNTRSREAAPGYPAANPFAAIIDPLDLPPTEYNDESYNLGLYAEDTQKFLDDKLTVRAGGRFDLIDEKLIPTENDNVNLMALDGIIPVKVPSFNTATKTSQAFTYRAGTTYEATKWLTLRASVGSGFRAANPTELYAATIGGNGVTILGNPNLKDETSLGFEFGGNIEDGPLSIDLAYFNNTIYNHILQSPVVALGATVYQWTNLQEEDASGLEYQVSYDIARARGWKGYSLQPYVSGDYYIEDTAHYTAMGVSNAHINFINNYQAAIGLRGGQSGKWSADLCALVYGPSYEFLAGQNVPAPVTEPAGTAYIGEKSSYWLLNTRESYQINKNLSLFFGINNILNRNYDPYFFGLNDNPSSINPTVYDHGVSGLGSSAPGREYFGGFAIVF